MTDIQTVPEIPAQFPVMTTNQGNFTYHLTLDKSVNKALEKLVSVIVVNSVAIGAAAILAIWMIFAYGRAETEARMVEYYIHEVDGKLIAAGFLKPSQNFDNFKREKQLEEKSQ
jgi:hypothetical protein